MDVCHSELLTTVLGCAPQLVTGYLEVLQKGEAKQFRDNFRAFVAAKKGIKIKPSPVKQHPQPSTNSAAAPAASTASAAAKFPG